MIKRSFTPWVRDMQGCEAEPKVRNEVEPETARPGWMHGRAVTLVTTRPGIPGNPQTHLLRLLLKMKHNSLLKLSSPCPIKLYPLLNGYIAELMFHFCIVIDFYKGIHLFFNYEENYC